MLENNFMELTQEELVNTYGGLDMEKAGKCSFSLITSTAAGTASGAYLGSFLGPLGTFIGGGIGGASGVIKGFSDGCK